jgi:hypothetical protein
MKSMTPPRYFRSVLLLALLASPTVFAAPGDFSLVQNGQAATLVGSPADDKVVALATNDLATDIERITGIKPATVATPFAKGGLLVLVGTLGKHPMIDRLAAEKKLDVSALTGAWESFIITVVEKPFPNVPQALVIAGSDRRGTAFGVYELSQQIGVSPWHWWADVAPEKKTALLIPAGTRQFGPPSVKYRGIFLNDEDWGLQPWAAKTFEPESGGIGPKTYAKIFELLLRLKANTLWPAMHACTKPFNADPRNAALADSYAIVMGSSHAEPMLRNNVGEWTAPKPEYNYVTNHEGVRSYWEERVRTNARYESIYTLGMRGIHDSAIQGTKTDAERINVLGQVFADQRAMIAKNIRPDVERVPQMFCAYKEVLDLYRQGLRVPDDVTIVWPDDNFGYIRNFTSADERRRSGGFGVYYHISYLGHPLSYLWLNTTPPALIWEEMTKAYKQGADRIWMVNVGDLKPAEIGTEFFLRLAWDIKTWGPEAQPTFLRQWAGREFGPERANEIADVMAGYYLLNFQRRPEHLQWWLPNQSPRPSTLTAKEIDARLTQFSQLAEQTKQLAAKLPASRHDAFEELVGYPVRGSALANERYFKGERGDTAAAQAADTALKEATRRFNDELAGGKWRGLMALEPADNEWKSMRVAPWTPPDFKSAANTLAPGTVALDAYFYKAKQGDATVVPGLGRTGHAVLLTPTTRLDYEITFPASESLKVQVSLLATYALTGNTLRLGLALDDGPSLPMNLKIDEGGTDWAQGVLSAERTATTLLTAEAGPHVLHLRGIDAGVVLDRIILTPQ